jgi:hypothetical protein
MTQGAFLEFQGVPDAFIGPKPLGPVHADQFCALETSAAERTVEDLYQAEVAALETAIGESAVLEHRLGEPAILEGAFLECGGFEVSLRHVQVFECDFSVAGFCLDHHQVNLKGGLKTLIPRAAVYLIGKNKQTASLGVYPNTPFSSKSGDVYLWWYLGL